MLEAVPVLLILLVGLVPLAFTRRRSRLPAALAVILLLVAAGLGLGWERRRNTMETVTRLRASVTPLTHDEDGYVGSARCQSCHPGEHATWHRSFHRTMTQEATASTVLADFDDVVFTDRGRDYAMKRKGDEFVVTFIDPEYDWSAGGQRKPPGPDDRPPETERPVVMVTGSNVVQVYWVAGARKRGLEFFPLVWKIDTAEWMPLADMFLKDPDSPEYLTRWNDACIQCHATAPRMRTRPASGAPAADELGTAVGELGISCEACHGPGRTHVEANGNPLIRYSRRLSAGGDSTIVNPARLPHDRASEVCGQCHALGWHRDGLETVERSGARYRPGDELARTRIFMDPVFPTQRTRMGEEYVRNHFWADGVVRVSGRDFSGMRKSKCYLEGELSCLSCHTMHGDDPIDQLSASGVDESACTDCHQEIAADVERHTRHAPGSSGSSCYECHMPHVTYGLLKSIRNHWIGSPSVRDDVEIGRPNACNLCHLDRTLEWTSDHLHEWFDHDRVDLGDDRREISATALLALTGDAAQRALAADALGRAAPREIAGEDWIVPLLATLLEDPYGAVRYIAERSLRSIPGYEDIDYDHLAAPTERAGAAATVLSRWSASPRPGEDRSAVLLLPDGRLDVEALGRLLEKRDDTPMELSE